MKNFVILIALFTVSGGWFGAAAQMKRAATEIKFGFLEKFEKTRNGYEINIDYAEMFEGDAATRAAAKDKVGYDPAELSGIYVRNKNPKIHREKLRADAVVVALKNLQPAKLTPARFVDLRAGKLPDADKFWGFPNYGASGGEPMPCLVTIENGAITKIEEVYFP